MSSNDIAISVKNLSKRYEIYDKPGDRLKQFLLPKIQHLFYKNPKKYFRDFWALKEVSFEVKKGETVGIIGKNGSGKSTLLQLICGTLAPTTGEVKTFGRIAALLELGSGFNPDFTGRENVYLNGAVLGLTKAEIEDRFEAIEAFADIGDFIDQPVKTYSSGMYVRLAFAVQVHIDASIVIIDEALAVGDIFFQQKCFSRLEELRKSGVAILFVSHGMTTVEQFCDRAVFLDHGRSIFVGPAIEATKLFYIHNQPSLKKIEVSQGGLSEQKKIEPKKNDHELFWPNNQDFNDMQKQPQIGTGSARLVRYVICDESGNPCNHFEQSSRAFFYYEFELKESIGVPLGGIVLQNARGINVHGKGSLEYAIRAPEETPANSFVRCIQAIELNLEVGEYTFELGLASIDAESYKNMELMDHDKVFSKIHRLCHVPQAGIISVGYRQVHADSQLTHHGIADLPGTFDIRIIEQ